MLLGTNDSYYSYPFPGLVIYLDDGTTITHPTIMINLLSVRDLNRLRMLENYGININVIHEDVCKRCIIGILHAEDKKIDYDKSPAGLLNTIANTIILKSRGMENDVESVFNYYAETTNIFDQVQLIVCKYTLTSLQEVKNYSIDRLIREDANIQKTFPQEVQELKLTPQ